MTTTRTDLTNEVADYITNASTPDLTAAILVAVEELASRYSETVTPVFGEPTGGPAPADPLAVLRADEKFVASVTEAARTWAADQSGEALDGEDADYHLGYSLADTVGEWLNRGVYPDGVEVNDITADAAHEYAIQGAGPRDIGREVRSLLTQEN